MSTDPLERSEIIEHEDGEFSFVYFNHHPELLQFFDERLLQGGGYTWEAIARAGLDLTGAIHSREIEFDPEADALYAHSTNREALEELRTIVSRAAHDIEFMEECLVLAESRGELE